jgi:ComF family protein
MLVCAACEAGLPFVEAACKRCAVPLPASGTCGECQRFAPRFDDAFALFEYRFPVDRLVHRFKFDADLAIGGWLAMRLAARIPMRPDVLVAPPLAPDRLRERGFNQSLEIAKRVARDLRIRLVWRGLTRSRTTLPQPGLGRAARRRNLREAFECRASFAGLHVAIVDDVLTTGATADALAVTIKRAGAARVSVCVVARTPDPLQP